MSVVPHPTKTKKEPGVWWYVITGSGTKRKRHLFRGSRRAAEAYELSVKNGYAHLPHQHDGKTQPFPIPLNDCPAVYFIQQGVGGPIKIGYTANSINSRIQTLQTSNPQKLRLVGYILGADEKKESQIHHQFRDFNIHGEWFYPSREIMEYLKTVSYSARSQAIVQLFESIEDLITGIEKEKADMVMQALVSRDRKLLEEALA